MKLRIGSGLDAHRLVSDRKLIIGGVDIPYSLGLEGHSDADVLTHAVMDALLGAAGLGDIGVHFPDTDPTYKGIDSILLLHKTGELLTQAGYQIGNIDCTIIAQAPKMFPHFTQMRQNLAAALGLETDNVSVKATTTEHMGFTGRGEGIAAQAVCLIWGRE